MQILGGMLAAESAETQPLSLPFCIYGWAERGFQRQPKKKVVLSEAEFAGRVSVQKLKGCALQTLLLRSLQCRDYSGQADAGTRGTMGKQGKVQPRCFFKGIAF